MSLVGPGSASVRRKNWPGHSVAAVLARPQLWFEALRALASMSKRGRLGTDYLSWRTATAYGISRPVTPEDLIDYLKWRRRIRNVA